MKNKFLFQLDLILVLTVIVSYLIFLFGKKENVISFQVGAMFMILNTLVGHLVLEKNFHKENKKFFISYFSGMVFRLFFLSVIFFIVVKFFAVEVFTLIITMFFYYLVLTTLEIVNILKKTRKV